MLILITNWWPPRSNRLYCTSTRHITSGSLDPGFRAEVVHRLESTSLSPSPFIFTYPYPYLSLASFIHNVRRRPRPRPLRPQAGQVSEVSSTSVPADLAQAVPLPPPQLARVGGEEGLLLPVCYDGCGCGHVYQEPYVSATSSCYVGMLEALRLGKRVEHGGERDGKRGDLWKGSDATLCV